MNNQRIPKEDPREEIGEFSDGTGTVLRVTRSLVGLRERTILILVNPDGGRCRSSLTREQVGSLIHFLERSIAREGEDER